MRGVKLILSCVIGVLVFKAEAQQLNPDKDYLFTVNTEYGKIKLILYDDTPLHKQNFVNLVKEGVYNHNIFHRVINHFMIQTGDYTTRNQPIGYDPRVIQKMIPAEILEHYTHVHGAIGSARKGDDLNPERNSNPTQFYIIQNRKGAHHLDGKYTIFGQVMSGFEVIDSIAIQPTSSKDRSLKNIRITIDVDIVDRSDVEKFYNFTYK